jgi:multimeric flavodoxin WrbA
MLLRKVLSPIARAGIDTELVQVGGVAVRGCTACYHCMETKDKRCAIKTDTVNEWSERC